jgi:hypothetical protein
MGLNTIISDGNTYKYSTFVYSSQRPVHFNKEVLN